MNLSPDHLAIFQKLQKILIKKKKSKVPLILGISGIDTAGKTIFSQNLREYLEYSHLSVQIISLDDFHNPRSIRYQDPDPITSYIEHAFNFEYLITELLLPSKTQAHVKKTLTHLNLETDRFDQIIEYNIHPDSFILLEGVLLFRSPIVKYLDLELWLQIDFKDMLLRVKKRDVPRYGPEIIQKYHRKYIPIQKWFIDTYRPNQRADIVIDNANYSQPKILKSIW